MGEINALESGSNALTSLSAWHPHIQKRDFDVLSDIQVVYKIEALKYEADSGASA
jgi:mRNA-degrading endonuclease HigB of HigAB toxin-antitoxin module